MSEDTVEAEGKEVVREMRNNPTQMAQGLWRKGGTCVIAPENNSMKGGCKGLLNFNLGLMVLLGNQTVMTF